MKEFTAQTGGRYVYTDDLINLQELALAFGAIFDECDNFIISGCKVVDGNKITAGYVYINGKIRYFNGASNITNWPQYIYEANSIENVNYESGGMKEGRRFWGCTSGSVVDINPTALTGTAPRYIAVQQDSGGLRMKDAFMGKYALILNPVDNSQTINSKVVINGPAEIQGQVKAQTAEIGSGTSVTLLAYDNDKFAIETIGEGSKSYKIEINENKGFKFRIDGGSVLQFNHDEFSVAGRINANSASVAGLLLSGGNITKTSVNGESEMWINRYGYNNGDTQYRTTLIGDGKGNELLKVNGRRGIVEMSGAVRITTDTTTSLLIESTQASADLSLVSQIRWDGSDKSMASVGFSSTTDQNFRIANSVGDVEIIGQNLVNIGPYITENGVKLTDKYALKADVYSKTTADDKYALKSGGLVQFVNEQHTQADCRDAIGAASAESLNQYARLDQYLGDMASTLEQQREICYHIGARHVDDPIVLTTEWLECPIVNTNSNIDQKMVARRYGNVITIMGNLIILSGGTSMFTLPTDIPAPALEVVYYVVRGNDNSSCAIYIGKDQRTARVKFNYGLVGEPAVINITYMI